MWAILLFGNTFGQTNKIAVDRDSLYNVFMNFEKEKEKVRTLERDTVIYRTLVLVLEKQNEGLMKIVKNNDSIVVPKMKEINRNLLSMLEEEKKTGNKKYWKGGRDFGLIGILIGIIVSSL